MTRMIRRYGDGTRLNHWFVALLFLCAGLSGLALFHPSLFGLSGLFGGGTWNRILHPFFGLLMVVGFVVLFAQVWRDNRWQRRDTDWLRSSPSLLRGNEGVMPPAGKYNAGQKGVFWLFTVTLATLLLTGFVFWQPWFAEWFSLTARRIAVLLHALAAFVLILGVILHVYAALWVKGSIRAMTRGLVSERWARRHHPGWQQRTGGE